MIPSYSRFKEKFLWQAQMSDNKPVNPSPPLDEKVIATPAVVPVLFHAEKQQILGMLILSEYTIQELSTALKLNPGTVKRHITDLMENNLVVQTRTDVNEYGIKLKYYRATARRFVVNLAWPEKKL